MYRRHPSWTKRRLTQLARRGSVLRPSAYPGHGEEADQGVMSHCRHWMNWKGIAQDEDIVWSQCGFSDSEGEARRGLS